MTLLRTPLPRLQALVRAGAARLDFAWALTWLLIGVDAAWLVRGGWTVPASAVAQIALAAAALHAPLALERYRHDARVRATAGAAKLLVVFMAAAATLSYLVVSTNARLVDPTLADWDRAVGFDWLALQAWLQSHARVQATLRLAYFSGIVQLLAVILFLGFTGRTARLDAFMRLFVVATFAAIVLSGPFPAAGPWKTLAPAAAAAIDAGALSHFELLRDGRMRFIPLHDMQGLISIPSLHAAMAVLFVDAVRRTILLPAFVVLDIAMLASTPVTGGHYAVDVLAGVGLALALIALDRRHAPAPRAADASAPSCLPALNATTPPPRTS